MATLADFRPGPTSSFPEFEKAPDGLVLAKLADAAAQLDVEVFGGLYDQAVGYLAAHLLAISPWGQSARLVAKDGTTTYGKAYDVLAVRVSGGLRLAGTPGALVDPVIDPFNIVNTRRGGNLL